MYWSFLAFKKEIKFIFHQYFQKFIWDSNGGTISNVNVDGNQNDESGYCNTFFFKIISLVTWDSNDSTINSDSSGYYDNNVEIDNQDEEKISLEKERQLSREKAAIFLWHYQ